MAIYVKDTRTGYQQKLDDAAGLIAAAIAAHIAASDPHAQYATDADLTAHEAAPDPHPQYLTVDEVPPSANGVPYYLGVGEIFTVPIYFQMLYCEDIEVDGTLEVDGHLIQV